MEFDVNYVAVLLSAIGALVVGGLWYSNFLFGPRWMELTGMTKEKAQTKAASAMTGMFVLSLVMAYMLSHVTYMSHSTFGYTVQTAGITSGFMMWVGFVLPVVLGTGLFEQTSKKLVYLNLGNWLATLLVMGSIIGYFGF